MSVQSASGRESTDDIQYTSGDFDEKPHMVILFNKTREVIYCNPIALLYFKAYSAADVNAEFYGLMTEHQPDGRNSLKAFMRRFDDAEANTRSEFELLLPIKGNVTPVHILINHVPCGDECVFVVTIFNLATTNAETRLVRQEAYLNALDTIEEILLTSDHAALNDSMNTIAKILGQAFDASRVSIGRLFSNERIQNNTLQSDWQWEKGMCSGLTSMSCLRIPNIWLENMADGSLLHHHLPNADETGTAFLQGNDAQSVMLAPIIKRNEAWGYIALLYEEPGRPFTDSCRKALSSTGKLLASGIIRHDATEAQRNSIEANRFVLDSNPFNSIMFDEDANILDCNLSAWNFFQLSSVTDIKKKFFYTLNHMVPEYQPGGHKSLPFLERLATTFKTGHCEFETQLIVSGKPQYFNVIMKKVVNNNRDSVITYMFDLTAEKEIQFSLKYHNDLLTALNSVANLLLMADVKDLPFTMRDALGLIGRAASVDRAYIWKNHTDEQGLLRTTQVFEWSPNAEPQQNTELTTDILFDDVLPTWQECMQKQRSMNLIVKDGSPEERAQLAPQGIVSLLLVPIFLYDNFWGFIGFDDCHNERVFTDTEENILRICGFMAMVINDTIQNEVTVRLLAEREAALVSAQVKTNFLANMSHEIRTPMNAILGMTELILHEDTADSVHSYATDIRNACRGLLTIINDILDISKIESGKLEIIPVRYHTSSLLMDVVSIIKARTDKQTLAFLVNIDTNIPSELVGDELRIKQVLINILNNAVKFTHEGQIILTVSSRNEDNVCHLTFSVTDTGIGIKQEDMQKIFVLFQQIDTKKNRNVEGTGLGLAISKQLAEMMGGTIEMESEYGVGSTFTVSIKQPIANSDPLASLRYPERNSVLVYENRTTYLNSITHALNSLGCTFKVCSNRSEMYHYLDEFPCDYLFVSSLYVNKIQSIAAQKQPSTTLVVLNGDGNSYYKGNTISLAMPIHCIQVANILNDNYDNRSSELYSANIIAPEAKVLVVDDNAVNLKVAIGLLNIYKIQTDTALNGLRAVNMVRDTDYDLVFMDHMMPDMDGIDTTVAIRNLGEKYKNLPIVALTANAVGGVREMFKAEGMDDFLAKPIEVSKLNAVLKKWIPKDKQKEIEEAPVVADSNAALFEIPGVDTAKGVKNSGGIPSAYVEILAIYAADCKSRLHDLAKYHKQGNMKALTTCIHALKSSSANIGAEEIAHMAADLEAAGKTSDTSYIDTNMRRFSDSLALLLSNISSYLNTLRKEGFAPRKAEDLGFLHKALNDISLYLSLMDIDAMERILDELHGYEWEETIAKDLSQVKNYIDVFDYDGIEVTLAGLKATTEARTNPVSP